MSTFEVPEQYSFFPTHSALQELNIEMRTLMKDAKAPNTLKAYGHEWKTFLHWCQKHDCLALPAQPRTIALFVTWQGRSDYDVGTIRLGLAAIRYFHAERRLSSPIDETVREVVSGIARKQARMKDPNIRPGKEALPVEILRRISSALLGGDPVDVRDRAAILVGFASAWRRSELERLPISGVTVTPEGATLRLVYSKGDQEGKGCETQLHYGQHELTCPVHALEAYLQVRGSAPGPLFVRTRRVLRARSRVLSADLPLTGTGVCGILKDALLRIGEDPDNFGAHSLRSGMITAADAKQVNLRVIMEHTRHKRLDTVMRYIKHPRTADPLAGVL